MGITLDDDIISHWLYADDLTFIEENEKNILCEITNLNIVEIRFTSYVFVLCIRNLAMSYTGMFCA